MEKNQSEKRHELVTGLIAVSTVLGFLAFVTPDWLIQVVQSGNYEDTAIIPLYGAKRVWYNIVCQFFMLLAFVTGLTYSVTGTIIARQRSADSQGIVFWDRLVATSISICYILVVIIWPCQLINSNDYFSMYEKTTPGYSYILLCLTWLVSLGSVIVSFK